MSWKLLREVLPTKQHGSALRYGFFSVACLSASGGHLPACRVTYTGPFADDAIEPALEVAHSMVEQFLPELAEPLRQRCGEVCPLKALYAQLNTFQDELLPPEEAESAADPEAEEPASAGQEAAQWSDKESASGELPAGDGGAKTCWGG